MLRFLGSLFKALFLTKGNSKLKDRVEHTNQPAAKPALVTNPDDLAVRFVSSLLDSNPPTSSENNDNQFEMRLQQQLERELAEFSDQSLPKIAQASANLMKEILKPDYSRERVLELFKQDPALAGKVIQIANSAYYTKSRVPISSLDHAISMLGADGLRRLIMTTLIADCFDIKPIYFKLFGAGLWNHSYQVALGAEKLLEDCSEQCFTGYICGLLHDIGKLAIFRQMLKLFEELPPDCYPRPHALAQLTDQYSHRLTIRACEHWQLPSDWIAPLIELQQPKAQISDIASALLVSNLSAEISTLENKGYISDEERDSYLLQSNIAAEQYQQLQSVFNQAM